MAESYLLPGQLWPRLLAQSDYALKTGALQPITTAVTTLAVGEIDFVVRILTQIHRKKITTEHQHRQKINPFLPYDPDLFVGHFSDTHLGLLNKFKVVDQHLLIVTRQFEDQQRPLTPEDLGAAVTVLQEKEGLVFYNSGPKAGASQPHRHLQWIPFPLIENGYTFPLADHFISAKNLPFKTAIAPLTMDIINSDDGGKICHQLYRDLLGQLSLQTTAEEKPHPYNLLMTREFLAIIPRCQESYQDIEVNALGFAGGLLVRNQQQLELLQQLGPWKLLQNVGIAQ
ncbi:MULTISPECIES: DUF4922 domain-containing protein [unclassified Synechocystis]|uniref:ATP adenylyltransferase family protein n=1 Tax=unclassified Synechocystis TaxID=2640012 RepID=UPI0003FE1F43|nr:MULTISPECIES: DUF4922 domain-containing protein [unclassified Synechocystis]AIE75455.1 Ap4A phosphorylase II [Synechocystis sp. PCC 6714]MCT0253675.1 phosphorylase [Synechocystis sp. CS-94]